MTKGESSPKPPAKLETINLKAFIHCEGCRRKIRRVIRCLDGVEDVVVDPATGKVTVTGTNMDAKIILQRLQKYGKQAEIWPNANAGPSNAAGKPAGGNQPKAATSNASNADINPKKKNNTAGENGGSKPVGNASSNEGKKGGGKKEETTQVTDQKGEEGAGPSEKKTEKSKQEKSKESNADSTEGGEPSMPQHNGGGGGGGGGGKKGKKGGNGTGNDGSNSGGNGSGGVGMWEHPPHIAVQDRPIPSIPTTTTTTVAISANKGNAPYDYIQTGYAEYNSVDYATHMFSDENANNCSIM